MKTRARAWAKFIVSGEHAVMFGSPCLAYPLKQCSLEILLEEKRGKTSGFDFLWNSKQLPPEQEATVNACLEEVGFWNFFPIDVAMRVESQIPVGSGLGSSAAFCVALARLLPVKETEIFERALRGEKAFHGSPSGVDPACVMSDRPIVYSRQTMHSQPFVIHDSFNLFWVLRDSGERHETSRVLTQLRSLGTQLHHECVAELGLRSKELIDLLSSFSNTAVERSSVEELLKAIQLTHEKMQIVSPAMRSSMQSLKEEGAIACKLTGAGCGGYVLGLFDESKLKSTYKRRPNDFVVSFSGDDGVSF